MRQLTGNDVSERVVATVQCSGCSKSRESISWYFAVLDATEQGFVVTDDDRVLCGDCCEKENGK